MLAEKEEGSLPGESGFPRVSCLQPNRVEAAMIGRHSDWHSLLQAFRRTACRAFQAAVAAGALAVCLPGCATRSVQPVAELTPQQLLSAGPRSSHDPAMIVGEGLGSRWSNKDDRIVAPRSAGHQRPIANDRLAPTSIADVHPEVEQNPVSPTLLQQSPDRREPVQRMPHRASSESPARHATKLVDRHPGQHQSVDEMHRRVPGRSEEIVRVEHTVAAPANHGLHMSSPVRPDTWPDLAGSAMHADRIQRDPLSSESISDSKTDPRVTLTSGEFVSTDVLPQTRGPAQQPLNVVDRSLGQHQLVDEMHRQYEQRALQSVDSEMDATTDALMSQMPGNYQPWWNQLVARDRRPGSQPIPVNLDTLILSALQNSPHIQAVETSAPIARTNVFEAEAKFDWHAFIDTKWDDLSDPVGNVLTTGGSPRFRDHVMNSTAGVRRKLTSGGELEIGQRIGYQDNNSRFFVPSQQATSQLTLSYTQPLLNGAGQMYNLSRVVLAELEADSAESTVSKDLQTHLLEVASAYWELYRARALTAQKRRLLEQARVIRERLAGRQGYDSLKSQLARAQSAVAARNAELIRAELATRNAETRLRVLVNDPRLLGSDQLEFIPNDTPVNVYFPISKRQSLLTALRNRPEIVTGLKSVQASTVQLGVAKQDILPTLDVVLETYVYGLEGQTDFAQSYINQFKLGEPSYSIGLQFEVPLGQRAARARQERKQLELQQSLLGLRATMETVNGEVETAVRDTETAYREMQSRYVAMQSAEAEVNYLYSRWVALPGRNGSTSWLLQDLLDSQERRAAEEASFVASQVNYMLSLTRLKKSIGTLLTVGDAAPPTQPPVLPPGEYSPASPGVAVPPPPPSSFGHSMPVPGPPAIPPSQEAYTQ